MRFLDERRARASGRPTPRRLRVSLALLLLGLGLAYHTHRGAQDVLEQTERIEERARDLLRRQALQELEAYRLARSEAQAQPPGEPRATTEHQPQERLDQRVLPLLSAGAQAEATGKLAAQDRQALASAQRQLVLTGGLVGLLLLATQITLARRTRRALSVPALAATGLVAWGVVAQWRRLSAVATLLAAEQVPAAQPGETALVVPALVAAAVLLWLGFWQRWREFE